MTTRSGELSVRVRAFVLLSKALRALPSKNRPIADKDVRYRQRYLDLITNPHARRTFEIRFAVLKSIRQSLAERDFIEVETAVLDTAATGAAGRPFLTY